MKKKILIILFAGAMLSGCYTHICPTYSVKPEKKKEIKAHSSEDILQKDQKQSS